MITGELILKNETVYTPPMPRRGTRALFAVNVLKFFEPTALAIVVQNKNFGENEDSFWVGQTTFTISESLTPHYGSVFVDDLKEEVRLQLSLPAGMGNRSARVFIYDPVWED